MAKEIRETVKNETKSGGSSLTPILIIGAIFAITILGIYWISQSGGDEGEVANSNQTTSNSQASDGRISNYGNAPAGAQPANFKGSTNSPVVIEEFADFQCPTCAVVHPKMNEVISRYSGRAKFVYRHFPISNIHQNAYGASVAAEAAGMQGKFWEMQNQLFQNQNQWARLQNPKDQFQQYAQKIGLDIEKFNNDLAAMNTRLRVDADLQRARALQISSTPTVLINGKPVPFQQVEVDTLSKLIDEELKKFDQANSSSQPKPAESKPASNANAN